MPEVEKEKDRSAAKPADKKVAIINQGNGPMHTAHGVILPGHSLEVPESLAKKLVGAYKHLKLASDIVPGQKAAEDSAAEIVALKKDVTDARKSHKAAEEARAGLVASVLSAKSLKDLQALQAKLGGENA